MSCYQLCLLRPRAAWPSAIAENAVHGQGDALSSYFASWLPNDSAGRRARVSSPIRGGRQPPQAPHVTSFPADAVRSIERGGRLHLWTDVEGVLCRSLELIAQYAVRGPARRREEPAEHDLDFRTHFERRMRLHGEAVYRSEFEKKIDWEIALGASEG